MHCAAYTISTSCPTISPARPRCIRSGCAFWARRRRASLLTAAPTLAPGRVSPHRFAMTSMPHAPDPGARPEGISADAAARHVREMFNAVAPRYDFANHLLSLATDVYWRRIAAARIVRELPPQAEVLDICCGTGDLSFALAT